MKSWRAVGSSCRRARTRHVSRIGATSTRAARRAGSASAAEWRGALPVAPTGAPAAGLTSAGLTIGLASSPYDGRLGRGPAPGRGSPPVRVRGIAHSPPSVVPQPVSRLSARTPPRLPRPRLPSPVEIAASARRVAPAGDLRLERPSPTPLTLRRRRSPRAQALRGDAAGAAPARGREPPRRGRGAYVARHGDRFVHRAKRTRSSCAMWSSIRSRRGAAGQLLDGRRPPGRLGWAWRASSSGSRTLRGPAALSAPPARAAASASPWPRTRAARRCSSVPSRRRGAGTPLATVATPTRSEHGGTISAGVVRPARAPA